MTSKAVGPILKLLHLRPVKSVKFTFDPFSPNVASTREVLSLLHVKKIKESKENVKYHIDVKANRCEPEINVLYDDGDKVKFKMENLSTPEVLKKMLHFSEIKDIKKEEPSPISAKLEKKKPIKKKK